MTKRVFLTGTTALMVLSLAACDTPMPPESRLSQTSPFGTANLTDPGREDAQQCAFW